MLDREAAPVATAGARTATEPRGGLVLVAGLGTPAATDYAEFVGHASPGRAVPIDAAGGWRSPLDTATDRDRADALIVFVGPRLNADGRLALEELAEVVRRRSIPFVGIVGSFRVHLDDPEAGEAEQFARSQFEAGDPTRRVIVFRPGHLVGPRSTLSRWLRRLAPLAPLVPKRLATCVLESSELFEAIESERLGAGRGAEADGPAAGRALGRVRRTFTLLGPNTPWRELLDRHRAGSAAQAVVRAVATVLSWLLAGQVFALAATLLTRLSPRARAWHVTTLKPRSFGDLIALCHAGNADRVRVVGYNNGVNHFGHRHPGRTIVSTVRCNRTVHAGPGRLRADSGATIHDAMVRLTAGGEELYVLPNYSYVSLGTAIFVPIHGSAVDYATVADTFTRVLLYDPDRDRIVSATREDSDFAANVYNPRSRAVLLRLDLRTKPKSSYYVRREVRTDATAAELLAALRDREAANVEIRQGHAASRTVTIARYYTDLDRASGSALELPRDALGRLWDRLEENPVTAFLMHALSRHVAWHTELFFTEDEFETFWRTHAALPLRKIQLRYIRRDGMPHSPFRDEDRVSADLFLLRTDKRRFDAYTADALPSVRYNPGKHSN